MKTHYLLNLKHLTCVAGFLVLLTFIGCSPSDKKCDHEEANGECCFHDSTAGNVAEKIRAKLSSPLPMKSYKYMKDYFNYAYLNGVNANLDTPKIAITPNTLNSYILLDTLKSAGSLLAIHYVALPDPVNASRRYLTYALAWAKKVDGKWQHKGLTSTDGANKYLLLRSTGEPVVITQDSFLVCQGLYKQLYNQSFTCNGGPKKMISTLDSHALSCYHDGKYFGYFYEDNILTAHMAANWKIRFDHGAIHIKIKHGERYWVHTPLLYFVDANGKEQIGPYLDRYSPFQNMVLDLGHLCPPDCDK